MSLWYTTCSNYPTESSPYDEMLFVAWLVIHVDVALGEFSCVCVCFPYSKKKSKRWVGGGGDAAFSSSGNLYTLLGSSRLLPWQLPVNIPAEFSHRRGESATFSLQTNRLDIPAENKGAEPQHLHLCRSCWFIVSK